MVGPAPDLASALKLAEAPIDAAILDLSLGRQTAYPLAEVLAARGVRFAFATGHGPDGLEPAWRGRPTLAKPLEFDDLKRAVDRLVAAEG